MDVTDLKLESFMFKVPANSSVLCIHEQVHKWQCG